MSFREVGQQLRAYRLGSGLKADDISARLGISRAALYRYEKGGVIKLETITRLAELLKISPLALLGIGFEYYAQPTSYAERLRQIEETADQILQAHGPVCYLLSSEQYDSALSQILEEHATTSAADILVARAEAEQLINLMQARKKTYLTRKPAVIAILTVSSIRAFLAEGLVPTAQLCASTRTMARKVAREEMERIASLMESEPLGLQLGLMAKGELNAPFTLYRARERASLALTPFPSDSRPDIQLGVAMITNAEDAINAHQHVYEHIWPEAIKGSAAARQVRDLIMETHP